MPRTIALVCVAIACACRPSEPARLVLPSVPPAVCAKFPLLLDLRFDSRYYLNTNPMDSVALAKWITTELPLFPEDRRNLMIRDTSTARDRDLAWIAAAVEHQHGHVFRDDGTCHPTVAIR